MTHRGAAVASRAIELSLQRDPFTADDIRRGLADPPSRSTVYRVLRQLEAADWIEQRGNGWHPDLKAQMLGGSGGGDVDTDGRDRGDQAGGGFGLDLDEIL